jgi:hypothetical protein
METKKFINSIDRYISLPFTKQILILVSLDIIIAIIGMFLQGIFEPESIPMVFDWNVSQEFYKLFPENQSFIRLRLLGYKIFLFPVLIQGILFSYLTFQEPLKDRRKITSFFLPFFLYFLDIFVIIISSFLPVHVFTHMLLSKLVVIFIWAGVLILLRLTIVIYTTFKVTEKKMVKKRFLRIIFQITGSIYGIYSLIPLTLIILLLVVNTVNISNFSLVISGIVFLVIPYGKFELAILCLPIVILNASLSLFLLFSKCYYEGYSWIRPLFVIILFPLLLITQLIMLILVLIVFPTNGSLF